MGSAHDDRLWYSELAKEPKATLTAMGRVDRLGVPRSDGEFIGIVYEVEGAARHSIVLTVKHAREFAENALTIVNSL